ncbi:choice-of-anchor E domain-containing protein [Neptunomonas sp. XY-337]|uniref:choice-of-anchor E domain-containing protein n=1 Tax=Neptunomonas sp. XY-337 TaxID=2561897 RepID=UPI00145B9D5C|nr:choice-of-anchor E domain-containing protein [Neptunomonas sp. XY-337]
MAFAKKALAAAVLTVAATSASAALELVQTQTGGYGYEATIWNHTLTFDLFNPANFDGRALQRVELELSGESATTFNFTPTNSAVREASGDFGAKIYADVSVTSGLIAINVNPTAKGATDRVEQNVKYDFGLLEGSDAKGTEHTDAATLAGFTGTDTFNVQLEALASITFNAVGGNYVSEQEARALGNFTVKYYVEELPPAASVPAPASLALFGLGLLAMSRKRKAA